MIYNFLYCNIPYFDKKLTIKQAARMRNAQEYDQTLAHLIDMRVSQYQWTGLPDTCNARFFELALLRGCAVMVKDGDNYLTLAAAPADGINIYGDTTRVYGYGANGFNKSYTLYVDGAQYDTVDGKSGGAPDAVLCRDNPIMYPEIGLLMRTADRMTYTMRSMDIVTTNLRTPTVIEADPKEVKSIKDMYEQIDDGVPAVFARRDNIVKNAELYNVGQDPGTLKVLRDHYNALEEMYRERVGIQGNGNPDKMAQISRDEIHSNDQMISMSQNIYLSERKSFCRKVNKLWGLHVNCDLAVQDKALDMETGEREDNDSEPDM